MNKKASIVINALGLVFVIAIIIKLFEFFIFPHLNSWIISSTNKYLVLYLNSIDLYVINLFPLVIALIQIFKSKIDEKVLFRSSAAILSCISLMLLIGLIVAWFTWPSLNPEGNTLIPLNYKIKPFEFYWTIFIVTGILIAIFYYTIIRKQTAKQHN